MSVYLLICSLVTALHRYRILYNLLHTFMSAVLLLYILTYLLYVGLSGHANYHSSLSFGYIIILVHFKPFGFGFSCSLFVGGIF